MLNWVDSGLRTPPAEKPSRAVTSWTCGDRGPSCGGFGQYHQGQSQSWRLIGQAGRSWKQEEGQEQNGKVRGSGWETLGRLWEWGTVHPGESNPGGVSGWRCGKGRSPGCRGHGLGVSGKQGQDMDSGRVPEAACERGQQDRGGRGERTQMGMGWASRQHPIELWGGWRQGAVATQPSALLLLQRVQLWALCWPQDVPTGPSWSLPFFPFIFIYLLTFMNFPSTQS